MNNRNANDFLARVLQSTIDVAVNEIINQKIATMDSCHKEKFNK
jgi:hypothetical protein